MLKLIAWEERHVAVPRHDAIDIRMLIDGYADSWNVERLYEDGGDFLEGFGFDNSRAAAALLGRDMASIARPSTTLRIRQILEREVSNDAWTLAIDMGRARTEENLILLEAVLTGVTAFSRR